MATIVPPAQLHADRIMVWDLPLRLFHWALVISIAVAFLSSEEDSPLSQWHMLSGWIVAVLLVFRVVWGFVGGEHSRFADFLRPSRIGHHVSGLLGGAKEASLGHNPIGALAIVVLLGLSAATVGTGAFGGESAEDLHETLAWVLLGMVGIHVAAVVVMSFLERENLPLAMITGTKSSRGHPGAVDARRPGGIALLLAAVAAAGAVYVILQYDPQAFTPRSTETFEQEGSNYAAAGLHDEEREDD